MRKTLMLLSALTLAACPIENHVRCTDRPTDPLCIDDAGVGDGGSPDAAFDAPTTDAHVPCNGSCTGATPHCLVSGATETCVGCTGPSDCSGGTSHCEPTSHTCVACVGNADCTTTAAAHCDTTAHTCGTCIAGADCTRFASTPVCDLARGVCAQCTGATEAARCGANACRRSDGTCTIVPRGSLDVCAACEADSECVTGRHCVHQTFMGTDVGAYCFLDASGGCGDTMATLQPYSFAAMLSSVDGVAAMYCLPPPSTTCQGIADTESRHCSMDTDCGLAGQSDGVCPTTGTGAGLCTYPCAGAIYCNMSLTCGGAPQHCHP